MMVATKRLMLSRTFVASMSDDPRSLGASRGDVRSRQAT